MVTRCYLGTAICLAEQAHLKTASNASSSHLWSGAKFHRARWLESELTLTAMTNGTTRKKWSERLAAFGSTATYCPLCWKPIERRWLFIQTRRKASFFQLQNVYIFIKLLLFSMLYIRQNNLLFIWGFWYFGHFSYVIFFPFFSVFPILPCKM